MGSFTVKPIKNLHNFVSEFKDIPKIASEKSIGQQTIGQQENTILLAFLFHLFHCKQERHQSWS
jgi:uncharacterized membrane protein